jgi:hypothetical protein
VDGRGKRHMTGWITTRTEEELTNGSPYLQARSPLLRQHEGIEPAACFMALLHASTSEEKGVIQAPRALRPATPESRVQTSECSAVQAKYCDK